MDALLLTRPPAQPRLRHAIETLRLAGPLAVAQLAGMAMGVTNTVLLGALGGDALAAGGLGSMLFITLTILFQGMLTAVSIVVAQARGAGNEDGVAAPYWAGLAMALLLSVPPSSCSAWRSRCCCWPASPRCWRGTPAASWR